MLCVAELVNEFRDTVGVYGPGIEQIVRASFDEGRRSVQSVLERVDEVTRIEMDPSTLFNVNTQADYDRLIERHGL